MEMKKSTGDDDMTIQASRMQGISSTPSSSFFNSWEKPDYREWGTFSVDVAGTPLTEKQYFEKYISRLLRGNDQEPPGLGQYAKGVYDQFISKAIGGGADIPPHVKAYLSRSDEIRRQGGYKGEMKTELGDVEINYFASRMNMDRIDNEDRSYGFGIKSPGEESSVITTDDQVIIGGIALDISKSKSMGYISYIYA
ncbi:MAG: hypothetical protein AB9903_18445 [Vulcanimicrobiota bacterium]